MHQPFYFRYPEYRYMLRSNQAYGWWTGVIRGELQFLRSVGMIAAFKRDGELLRVAGIEDYLNPPKVRRKILTGRKDQEDRIEAILSERQKMRWKEIRGKPLALDD